ncbi:hypothetical protein AB0D04_36625 [Streptomyces sp. NPDC048483]
MVEVLALATAVAGAVQAMMLVIHGIQSRKSRPAPPKRVRRRRQI